MLLTTMLSMVLFITSVEGQGIMSQALKTRIRKAQVDKCNVITTTINVPFLETPLAGDILVKLPVVTKLHCEDMCLRNPHCKGFNFNDQLKECDLLKTFYREQDRETSLGIRSFMKQFLLNNEGCNGS